jgi:hypothetical protein
MPGDGDAADLEFSDETAAKTLRLRAVLAEPQVGHFTFSTAFIERWRCSKLFLQDWQVYS